MSLGCGEAMAARHFVDNPFYVLALPVTASRIEVERAAQRWLAMLELGLSSAESSATPIGDQPRTTDGVRRAAAELRDPERWIEHELWARLPPRAVAGIVDAETRPTHPAAAAESAFHAAGPWAEALSALGWARAAPGGER